MLGLFNNSFKPRHVHVVGAGLSGLACALHLQSKGVPVTLYEATNQAGGRCRSYEDKQLGCTLDNGNHLILRANRATIKYIKRLHKFNQFRPFASEYAFADVVQNKRWKVTPPFVPGGWRGWKLLTASGNKTVEQCFDTGTHFYHEFVEPLCLAALNTHPRYASAKLLRNVWLRMLIPSYADYLQIRTDFNAALITPALAKIKKVELMQRLRGIELADNRIASLQFTEFRLTVKDDERVVLALPPEAISELLPTLNLPPLEHNTIINGHFLVDSNLLSPRLLGVINSPLHWVFLKRNILSTTTSHGETSELYQTKNIADTLWQEITKCYPTLRDSPLPPHRIVTEKRATIASTATNLAKRPSAQTPYENLALAGDWLASPYPACIEAAIKSGTKAAKACLKQRKQ